MSMTALERNNPPSRRRSCAACTKAKRRCDFALPACLRCSRRRIQCMYPARRCPESSSTNGGSGGRGCHATGTRSRPEPPPFPTGDIPCFSVNTAPPPLPPMTTVLDPLDDMFRLPEDADLESLLATEDLYVLSGGDGGVDQDLPDIPSYCFAETTGQKALATVLSCGEGPPPEPGQLIYIGVAMPLFHTKDGWEPRHIALEERLAYTIEVIQKAPESMAREVKTPWSHPLLYKETMPKIMRDAQAACALYQFRNPINGPVVLRTIESNVRDLVNSPIPSSAGDILARTHALILYCIMRIFDGDIAARASAERDLDALEASTMALLPHVKFHDRTVTDQSSPSSSSSTSSSSGYGGGGGGSISHPSAASTSESLPLFPIAETDAFWREWIFQESARRTALIGFTFLMLFDLISVGGTGNGNSRGGPVAACYRSRQVKTWTLSAHLWGAPSAVDFALAWRTRRHFIMSSAQVELFEAVVGDGDASDFDDFGKMFLAAYMGVTQARGWFLSKGGVL